MSRIWSVLGWIVSAIFLVILAGEINWAMGLTRFRTELFDTDFTFAVALAIWALFGAIAFNPIVFRHYPFAKGPVGRTSFAILLFIAGLVVGIFGSTLMLNLVARP